jgi:hypothetical protein
LSSPCYFPFTLSFLLLIFLSLILHFYFI